MGACEAIESDVDALADDPPDVRCRVFVLIQLERHDSALNSTAWLKFSIARAPCQRKFPDTQSAGSNDKPRKPAQEACVKEQLKFYIDGKWVKPLGTKTIDVINPATEEVVGRVSLGTKEDVDRAVSAARKAFPSYSQTTKEERIALIEKIMACYQERIGELAATVSQEMGAPKWLANAAQAPVGMAHIMQTL